MWNSYGSASSLWSKRAMKKRRGRAGNMTRLILTIDWLPASLNCPLE